MVFRRKCSKIHGRLWVFRRKCSKIRGRLWFSAESAVKYVVAYGKSCVQAPEKKAARLVNMDRRRVARFLFFLTGCALLHQKAGEKEQVEVRRTYGLADYDCPPPEA